MGGGARSGAQEDRGEDREGEAMSSAYDFENAFCMLRIHRNDQEDNHWTAGESWSHLQAVVRAKGCPSPQIFLAAAISLRANIVEHASAGWRKEVLYRAVFGVDELSRLIEQLQGEVEREYARQRRRLDRRIEDAKERS